MLEKYPIDGIECIHSYFSQEEIEYLTNLSEEKGYYKSDGSDYHGENNINISLAIGKGNLNIPDKFVEKWA